MRIVAIFLLAGLASAACQSNAETRGQSVFEPERRDGITLAVCNQLASYQCQQDAKQCSENCRGQAETLRSRCQEECRWKLETCRTVAGCR